MNDRQEKQSKNVNLLAKYLKYENQAAQGAQSTRVNKVPKKSPKGSKIIEVPSSNEKNNMTIETKIRRDKVGNNVQEWFVPGKEDKVKAMNQMPVKKFPMGEKDKPNYRVKPYEEEKKLPLSDEKESSKQARTIHIEENPNKDPESTTELINQYYRIGKVLGKGAFGKVNLAIDRKSNELVAIKSLNKHYISDHSSKSKIMQEVAILKQIKHRNIVCMKEHFDTQNHFIFVMELCAGGDLLNYVRKRRKLNENTAKVVFKQILEGLHYCHSNNVLHRDIKLDNILLDSRGEVKIGDFGVSKIVKDGELMTDQ
jgi:tRNA A-37 threonylcarbamoyl transferase component Bud32